MTLNEFVNCIAGEYEETPADQFTADTKFKELDDWGSLTALSIIGVVDEEFDVTITGADIRSCTTIEDLYNLIQGK